MSTVQFKIPDAALKALDKKLAGLQGIQQSKILLDGMRAAGRAVRKRAIEIAPTRRDEFESAYAVGMISESTIKSWRSSQNKANKASLKTEPAYKIKAFVRELEPILEVRVKAAKRAPHFHLVELGHRIVTRSGVDTGRRTRPTPFISLGGKYSNREQVAEMQKGIQRAITKLIGG
jgi:hypothetical protein